MQYPYETLLIILIAASAIAFSVQCLAIWRAARSFGELANQLERQSKQLERSLTTVQGRLEEVIDDLKPLGEMAETVHTQITDIGETLHSRAGDVDQFVEEVLQLGREQASKVDYLVTDTVQKFEETTEVIQRDVLRPAIEISSLVKGVKAGLDVLLSRKSSRAKDGSSEEEMFI